MPHWRKPNHAILYDLLAVQKENVFGNATLQSTKQCLQEVKTQASSLANVAQATAVASKAFLQFRPQWCMLPAANHSKPIAVSDNSGAGAPEDNSFDKF